MKKIYIQPTTKVVETEVQAILLGGSQRIKTYGLDDPLKYDDDDEEDDPYEEGV